MKTLMLFMRALVMLSDIAIGAALMYLLYLAPINVVVWIVIAVAVKMWVGGGGFVVWNHRT